jgi:hypothetical protein
MNAQIESPHPSPLLFGRREGESSLSGQQRGCRVKCREVFIAFPLSHRMGEGSGVRANLLPH